MVRLLASAVLLGCALSCAAASKPRGDVDSYPSRPVRVIVANTAGSGMDNVMRLVGQGLTDIWGQQIVVDDRPGAAGLLAHEIASKAAPDGYTLLFGSSAGAVINPLLMKLPYDQVRDFAPVSLIVNSVQVLSVHPSVAATTVPELLAIAKAKPGQLNCGSSGSNSSNHLACEMLRVMGHVDFVHVPFKGTVPQQMGLVSGQVHMAFASIPTTQVQAKVGKIRILAQGGPTRSKILPDLPTVAETLPGFQAMTWYAMYAPRATPAPIVNRANAAIVKVLSDRVLAQRLTNEGLDPAAGPPEELAAYMRAETERFTKLIKAANFKAAP